MTIPRVTIGVPVRNGASELASCLNCLTNQTFRDIEILILDNASTDRTPDIILEAMRTDPRIRYIRNKEDIGAAANFTATLKEARAPYFMWRAYDDLSDSNYVESLVAALDANPNAGLAAPNVETIRTLSNRRRLRMAPEATIAMLSRPAAQRRMIRQLQAGWIYGLFRREFLVEVKTYIDREFQFVWAVDFIMLVAAALRREIVGVPTTTLRLQLTGARKEYSQSELRAERTALVRNYWRVLEQLLSEKALSPVQRLMFRITFVWHIQRRVAKWPILIRALISK